MGLIKDLLLLAAIETGEKIIDKSNNDKAKKRIDNFTEKNNNHLIFNINYNGVKGCTFENEDRSIIYKVNSEGGKEYEVLDKKTKIIGSISLSRFLTHNYQIKISIREQGKDVATPHGINYSYKDLETSQSLVNPKRISIRKGGDEIAFTDFGGNYGSPYVLVISKKERAAELCMLCAGILFAHEYYIKDEKIRQPIRNAKRSIFH